MTTVEENQKFDSKVKRDEIRLSRREEEEFFLIETDIIASLDDEVTNSKIVFSLPGKHPVFEVNWGDDLNIGGGIQNPDAPGPIQAVVRLKPEWFWEEETVFDYRITITTSNGAYVEEGQAVVE